MTISLKSLSLLWRILLSTSLTLTALFAVTGWMVESYAVRVSEHSLEEEVKTSVEAYQAYWSARAHNVGTVSKIISSMSDVRAAFQTGDRATIRDTAEQLWSQVSEQDAAFLVLDPAGDVITSLGGDYSKVEIIPRELDSAMKSFPEQVAGFLARGQSLYYVVLTPVYVQSFSGKALLNILLMAVRVDRTLAETLKTSTNGSDFVFYAGDAVVASTLGSSSARIQAPGVTAPGVHRAVVAGADYLVVGTALKDIDNHPIGRLYVMRPFAGPRKVLSELQRNVAFIWGIAIVIGFCTTYLLARRIVEPVSRLDRAAEEVIKQNYDYRVPVETNDELGRLARTFNTMCDSIRKARDELIRQERIATIGRFATSIVHDLRSPLAAIYGGAEMLVDATLSPEQTHRLAANMYRASRRIQELLQELTDLGRGRQRPLEHCSVSELVNAARESLAQNADLENMAVVLEIPEHLYVLVERGRMERVFMNLLNNARDVMPAGGTVRINATKQQSSVLMAVEDTGPGLSENAWATLFQPFASFGKRNGLGLGLALARHTVLEHGGELWAEKKTGPGAIFYIRLPLAPPQDAPVETKVSNYVSHA